MPKTYKFSELQILLIQTAFLGDVILATALIEKLKCFYPDAEIDFLIKKGNERVLANQKIRELLIFDKKKKLTALKTLIGKIRKKKYDIVINVHRHFSSGLITVLSGAKQKIGFASNPLSFLYTRKIKHDWTLHEIERNQKLIAHITDDNAVKPKIYTSEEDFGQIEKFNGDYITISPASIWSTKELPLEHWADMANKLPDNLNVYLMGGPGDTAKCEELAALITHKNTEVIAGKYSIIQDAAIMSKAKMNYVLDSGPLHICSAMNAAVTVVFCSTSPKFGFGPLSDISFIVETSEQLSCRPCGPHGHKKCPEGHFKCGNITLIPKS